MSTLGLIDGWIVSVDRGAMHTLRGDVLVEDGILAAVGPGVAAAADQRLDLAGGYCLPGFVQPHVHLGQTLMRGRADDLALLDWLSDRVWPLEAAHTPESLAASARLGMAELLLGGTTSVLTMESVRHTDAVFEAALALGIRATIGKTHMDRPDTFSGLRESTDESLAEAERLCRTWHGRAGGRLRYAYGPRFAVSCTPELLGRAAALARRDGLIFHTHASENQEECARVRQDTGLSNVHYLDSLGCLGPWTVLAHCIHLEGDEVDRLARSGTHVVHCPTCNLKLGSGIADVPRLFAAGVNVSLGSDGAPCNNSLDMFQEMKLAAILHKVRHGPTALPAALVLEMATRGGARALHLEDRIGAIEVGRNADLIVVHPQGPHAVPRDHEDPASYLVYAGRALDIRHVVVDGQVVVRDGSLVTGDLAVILAHAEREAAALFRRAGV